MNARVASSCLIISLRVGTCVVCVMRSSLPTLCLFRASFSSFQLIAGAACYVFYVVILTPCQPCKFGYRIESKRAVFFLQRLYCGQNVFFVWDFHPFTPFTFHAFTLAFSFGLRRF